MPDSFIGLFPGGGLTPTGRSLGINTINQFRENVTKYAVAGTGILAKVISKMLKSNPRKPRGSKSGGEEMT